MIGSIVTRDTKREEWDGIQGRIKARIFETFGKSPVPLSPGKA